MHHPHALILIILLALTPTTLAVPDPRAPVIRDPHSPEARQQRLEAWKAQKPMHTTALLAGAAATAISESQLRNGRRRDLSGITGEKGMWIPIEFWDDGDEVDKTRGSRRGDVRGEKSLEAEVDDKGEDVEMEMEGYGIRDAFEQMWVSWEKIASFMQRKRQRTEKVKELHDGHDSGHDADL